ncbi:hypothetical protein ACHAXR_012271 [Thalassiosira sp. AJA248-18]
MSWHNNNIDDQYLFRLTSTFGWDEAISLCESLVLGIEKAAADSSSSGHNDGPGDVDETYANEAGGGGGGGDNQYYFNDYLLGQQQHQNEKSLEQWLGQAHTQLFYTDQWGNSPLHAASYVKPPLNMIEALFHLGRALWRHSSNYREQTPPLWATPCSDGSTPFLVACSTGASTTVLNRYMDEIEFYIEQKWVVHEKLARMLVIQPDNQGTNPLMGWMSFHHGWIKRQLLEQRWNNGSVINNVDNECNSHSLIPRRSRKQASSQTLSDFWDLACRILRFATMNIRPHSPPSTPVLVHRCAEIATYCPPSLLDWVVAPPRAGNNDIGWLPADLSAATSDNLGMLPMHRAMEALDLFSIFDEDIVHHGADFDASHLESSAKMPPAKAIPATTVVAAETVCPRAEAILYNNPKLEKNRLQIVEKLLQWHPLAASTLFRNGRTPLIQAIAHGGSWHQLGYYNGDSDSDSNDMGLLHLLWGYAPEQNLIIDPMTGLHPFMLAAAIPTELTKRNRLEHDHDVVDTVFNLLRKDPQLVAGGLTVGNAS